MHDDFAYNLDDRPLEPQLGFCCSSSPSIHSWALDLDFNPNGIFDSPQHTLPESDDKESKELLEIDHDPLFQVSEDLFNTILDSADTTSLEDSDNDSLPPTFDEDPMIPNTYITVYLLTTCHGSIQETIKTCLDFAHKTLMAVEWQTGLELCSLNNIAHWCTCDGSACKTQQNHH